MKIGIISDTHDDHRNVLKAIDVFNAHKVEYVLHAGDMISPFTARAFENLESARLIAVLGNNEGEKILLKRTFDQMGAELHDICFKGTIGRRRVFMTHVHHFIDELAKSGQFDLVIYGHTHKQDIRRLAETLIINPGETTDWLTGGGQVVICDLEGMDYEVIPL
jgi:putative phosphoesterase